jgi:hypothetical protein
VSLTDDKKVISLPKAKSALSGAALPGFSNFAVMRRQHSLVWPAPFDKITIQAALFRALLRLALEHVPVDERYYLRRYPDVGEAIEEGAFESPRHHYIEFGYFEDRLPFGIDVDEDFYLRANPDIKSSVESGLIPSAQVHFERHGFCEGRLPREGWSLLSG